MAGKSRYQQSKGDKIHKHIADHHAAYAKHFKAAAKDVPQPGAKGHDAAWQQAMQAAQAATAQDMAGAGQPPGGAAPPVAPPAGPAAMPPAAAAMPH